MNETIEVRIEKVVYGGDGLGRHEGRAVFVPRAAPGDLVRARVVEQKKSYLRAEISEILEPGPARRVAPCPYFGPCGGCQLQHIDYATQVAAKAEFVRDALVRIGHVPWDREVPVHASAEHELGYRLRATAHVAPTREGVVFGYYGAKSHRIVDVETCPLLVPELDAAWRAARAAREGLTRLRELELAAGDNRASAAPPVAVIGGGDLTVSVDGATYEYGPGAFFQVNRYMIESLVGAATGGTAGGRLAVDLYAGVGLFTVPLSRAYERVIAVEGSDLATEYARRNARENGAQNVEAVAAPVESWLERAEYAPGEIDLVVLDPPRGGLGQGPSAALAALGPREIVYVSCDPTTLARDLRVLIDAGYALESVEAFDLFPQTFHVETVARLVGPRDPGVGDR